MKPSLKRALDTMMEHPLVPPHILSIAAEVEDAEDKPLTPEQQRILQLQEIIIDQQMQILSITAEPKLTDVQVAAVRQGVYSKLSKYEFSELLMYYNRTYFSSIDSRLRQPIAQALVEYTNSVEKTPIALWQNLALTGEQQ